MGAGFARPEKIDREKGRAINMIMQSMDNQRNQTFHDSHCFLFKIYTEKNINTRSSPDYGSNMQFEQ
jgi:hypothetical protein